MSETKKYKSPKTPVAIPKGDTGFDTVKKGYNRMIWTWNQYAESDPDLVDPNKEDENTINQEK